MKKQKENIDFIISKFRKYDVPKYVSDELLSYAFDFMKPILIKNNYYRFDKNKSLVKTDIDSSRCFITTRKKIYENIKIITSVIYQYKDYFVERYFGISFNYNSKDYNYKTGLVACNIYSNISNKFYYFKKGIYFNRSCRTTFYLLYQKIIKSKTDLFEYFDYDYFYIKSKNRLINVKNKYIFKKNYLDLYDVVMINKYPFLETFYKNHTEPFHKHRKEFIKNFLKLKPVFNYKIFNDVCYRNISEYLVRIEYLGASFKDVPSFNYAYMLDLLEKKIDKKYIYEHRFEIDFYPDYLSMLKNDVAKDFPMYPKHIKLMHDELAKKIEFNNNLILQEKINKVINKYDVFNFIVDDYQFFIPTIEDMISYSNDLNLCIVSAGYIDKVVNGKCVLVFVKKINDCSFLDKFACELIKKDGYFVINQFHGFNNDRNIKDSNFYIRRRKLYNILFNKLNKRIVSSIN